MACGNVKKLSRFMPLVRRRRPDAEWRSSSAPYSTSDRRRAPDAQPVGAATQKTGDDDIASRCVALRQDDLRQPCRETSRGADVAGRRRNWRRESSLYSCSRNRLVLSSIMASPGQYQWKAFALIASPISSRAFASVNVAVPAYESSAVRVTAASHRQRNSDRSDRSRPPANRRDTAVVSTAIVARRVQLDSVVPNCQRGTMLPAQYSILSG